MITFGYRILRQNKEEILAKEEIIAEGETRHLCLDSNGKPKSMPEEFAAKLER
jgi:acyl-CoA thioesterase FadM